MLLWFCRSRGVFWDVAKVAGLLDRGDTRYLYMGNIADGVTEVGIHALFVEYNLQEVRLPRFSDTGGCDMPATCTSITFSN